MKKLLVVSLLIGFTVAVCHAVPYDHGLNYKTELVKKHFDLQPCELALAIEVAPAPKVIYDLVVPVTAHSFKAVAPQSNSPPKRVK